MRKLEKSGSKKGMFRLWYFTSAGYADCFVKCFSILWKSMGKVNCKRRPVVESDLSRAQLLALEAGDVAVIAFGNNQLCGASDLTAVLIRVTLHEVVRTVLYRVFVRRAFRTLRCTMHMR